MYCGSTLYATNWPSSAAVLVPNAGYTGPMLRETALNAAQRAVPLLAPPLFAREPLTKRAKAAEFAGRVRPVSRIWHSLRRPPSRRDPRETTFFGPTGPQTASESAHTRTLPGDAIRGSARGWELYSVHAVSRCRSGLIPVAPGRPRLAFGFQGLLGRAGRRGKERAAAQRSPREHSEARHPQRTASRAPRSRRRNFGGAVNSTLSTQKTT